MTTGVVFSSDAPASDAPDIAASRFLPVDSASTVRSSSSHSA